MEHKCGNCRHYTAMVDLYGERMPADEGECYRYPPDAHHRHTKGPPVPHNHWCGEFAPIVDPARIVPPHVPNEVKQSHVDDPETAPVIIGFDPDGDTVTEKAWVSLCEFLPNVAQVIAETYGLGIGSMRDVVAADKMTWRELDTRFWRVYENREGKS